MKNKTDDYRYTLRGGGYKAGYAQATSDIRERLKGAEGIVWCSACDYFVVDDYKHDGSWPSAAFRYVLQYETNSVLVLCPSCPIPPGCTETPLPKAVLDISKDAGMSPFRSLLVMGELVDNGLLDEYGRNPHGWDGLQALEIFTNWKAGGRCPTCGVVFKRSGTVHIEA